MTQQQLLARQFVLIGAILCIQLALTIAAPESSTVFWIGAILAITAVSVWTITEGRRD